MADTTDLMTVTEAAEILQVCKKTVYNHINRGALPHIKLGRVIRIKRQAFQEWLDARESGGA